MYKTYDNAFIARLERIIGSIEADELAPLARAAEVTSEPNDILANLRRRGILGGSFGERLAQRNLAQQNREQTERVQRERHEIGALMTSWQSERAQVLARILQHVADLDGKGPIEELSAVSLTKLAKEGLQLTRDWGECDVRKAGVEPRPSDDLQGLLAKYTELGERIMAIEDAGIEEGEESDDKAQNPSTS